MKPVLVLSALLLLATTATAACSNSAPTEGAFTNDLRMKPGAPVAKGGIADDSIKPLPTPVVGRVGVADDGVKPLPAPVVGKGGIPDDSIKPVGAAPVPPPARR